MTGAGLADDAGADLEQNVGTSVPELTALFAMESIKFMGPAKFRELHTAGISPEEALENPFAMPLKGTIGQAVITAVASQPHEARRLAHDRAVKQIATAARSGVKILTYRHASYPKAVFDSNDPEPVLYVLGTLDIVSKTERNVACVGSRRLRAPYLQAHISFCHLAAAKGFTIVSGFATGADTAGHRAAEEAAGKTVCVMPSGLDRPFPPENRQLWKDLLLYPGAAMVSQFPLGTAASQLTLRKRNKLIVAFSMGVLVSQSADKGGAMNAYRFGREQRKPVATFEPDGESDTTGNALIAMDLVTGGSALPVDPGEGSHAWSGWLSRLSFST